MGDGADDAIKAGEQQQYEYERRQHFKKLYKDPCPKCGSKLFIYEDEIWCENEEGCGYEGEIEVSM